MKKVIAIVAGVLLACAGLAAWRFALPQRMGWVGAADPALTLYGNVDIRQVQLGFRVSGRLAETLVDEGDTVTAGAPLARLDARQYEEKVRADEAQVASLVAMLDKLEAGPRAAEIAQAVAAHAERVAQLQEAQLNHDRLLQLRGGNAISQAELDRARTARDMAQAREKAAGEALRLLRQGTRAEDVAAASANLQAAQAALSSSKIALQDAELRAPDEGVILSRVRERGAIVSPSDVVFVLALTKPVWVRAYVPEPYLGRIHPGMAVEVRSDTAGSGPYRGTIGFISPVAEFTPKSVETAELRTDLVYRLRIGIDQPDTRLRQGMPVTIRIPDEVKNARSSL